MINRNEHPSYDIRAIDQTTIITEIKKRKPLARVPWQNPSLARRTGEKFLSRTGDRERNATAVTFSAQFFILGSDCACSDAVSGLENIQ